MIPRIIQIQKINVFSANISSGSVDLYIGGNGEVGIGMINNKEPNSLQVKGKAYQNETDPVKDFFAQPIALTTTINSDGYWKRRFTLYQIPPTQTIR